jgi:hypothetical protein
LVIFINFTSEACRRFLDLRVNISNASKIRELNSWEFRGRKRGDHSLIAADKGCGEENILTESVQSVQGKQTQSSRQRLLGLQGSWNGGSSKDDGGKKSKFNTVWLFVLDAIASKQVLWSSQSTVWFIRVDEKDLTRVPTVRPATMEGIEPL